MYVQEMVNKGSRSLSEISGHVASIGTAINDTAGRALSQSIAEAGGLRKGEAELEYKATVAATIQEARSHIGKMVSAAGERGEIVDPALVKSLYEELDAEQEYWLVTHFDMLNDFDTKKQADDAQDLRIKLTELRTPLTSAEVQGLSTGGVLGVGGQKLAFDILDPQVSRNFLRLMGEEAFAGANARAVKDMQAKAMELIVQQTTEGVTLQETQDIGETNPALVTMVASLGTARTEIISGAAFRAQLDFIDGYRASAQIKDDGTFIEAMDSLKSKARKISADSKSEHGNEAKAKEAVSGTLRAQLNRVKGQITDWVGAPEVRLQENNDGTLTPVFIQTVPDEVFNDANAFYRRKVSENMVRGIVELYSEYAKYGLANIEDLQDIAPQFGDVPSENEQQSGGAGTASD